MFAIEQSRGLIGREAFERSTRQATATATSAYVPPVSHAQWGSEAVVVPQPTSDSDRLKALEDRMAAMTAMAGIPPPPPLPPPRQSLIRQQPPRMLSPPVSLPVTSSPTPEFLQGGFWGVEEGTTRILPSQLPVGTIVRPAVTSPPTATASRPVPTLQLRADDSWINTGLAEGVARTALDLSRGDDDGTQEPVEDMDTGVPETETISSDDGTTIDVASTLSTATRHTAETEDVSDSTLITSPTQSDVEVVPVEPPDPPTVTLDVEPASPPPPQPAETERTEDEAPPPPEPPDS